MQIYHQQLRHNFDKQSTLQEQQAPQEEHDNFLRYTNKVHYQAWKQGLKSLYYLRSREAKSAENINLKVKRVRLDQDNEEEVCLSCQA